MTKPILTADPIAILAGDSETIPYRPRLNQITGSMAASVFLQQVLFQWVKFDRRGFYMFLQPCDHPLYIPSADGRRGNSWHDHLQIGRYELTNARAAIATKLTRTMNKKALLMGTLVGKKGAPLPNLVWYTIDGSRLTTYYVNEPALHLALMAVYNDGSYPPVTIQEGQKANSANQHYVMLETSGSSDPIAGNKDYVMLETSDTYNIDKGDVIKERDQEKKRRPAPASQDAPPLIDPMSKDAYMAAVCFCCGLPGDPRILDRIKAAQRKALQDAVDTLSDQAFTVSLPNGDETRITPSHIRMFRQWWTSHHWLGKKSPSEPPHLNQLLLNIAVPENLAWIAEQVEISQRPDPEPYAPTPTTPPAPTLAEVIGEPAATWWRDTKANLSLSMNTYTATLLNEIDPLAYDAGTNTLTLGIDATRKEWFDLRLLDAVQRRLRIVAQEPVTLLTQEHSL